MAETIPAKDITVAHIYQARCHRLGCAWSSELLGSYREAQRERNAHRAAHLRLLAGEDVDPGEFEPIAQAGYVS